MWTDRSKRDSTGQDPLGLDRIGGEILRGLFPGITSTTERVRYYSMFVWMIQNIHATEPPEDMADFASALFRREGAVAAATRLDDRASHVSGINVLKPKLEDWEEAGQVDLEDFKALPGNPLSTFGQYYRGSIQNLGLLSRDERGIPVLADGAASDLAEAVQKEISTSPYFKNEAYLKSQFPLPLLEASKTQLSLNRVPQGERRVLRKIFFESHSPSGALELQRDCLLALLEVVENCNGEGIRPPCDPREVTRHPDHTLLYPAFYYRQVACGGDLYDYEPPPGLLDAAGFLQQFCLHQYVSFAFEYILEDILILLRDNPGGLDAGEIAESLTGSQFRELLSDQTGKRVRFTKDLLRILDTPDGGPTGDSCLMARQKFDLSHDLNEEDLFIECLRVRDQHTASSITGYPTALAMLILGLSFAKWGQFARGDHASVVAGMGPEEWGFVTGNGLWAHWHGRKVTWPEAIEELVPIIYMQHERIRHSKGRLESQWLQSHQAKYTWVQEHRAFRRTSRSVNSLAIMADLGLLESLDKHELAVTKAGRRHLARHLKGT